MLQRHFTLIFDTHGRNVYYIFQAMHRKFSLVCYSIIMTPLLDFVLTFYAMTII